MSLIDEGAEWYQDYLSGDETCFSKIVIRYRNGLVDFINQYVNDYHSSEEIAEDVFVLLCVKKPRFSPSAQFKTWLYTIAKNRAINFIKKREKHNMALLRTDCNPLESSDQILHEIYQDDRKVALHKALDELSADYRLILHLHFYDGFSTSQIAVLLKRKPRAVSDALYNAKKALREVIIKEKEYEILR